MKAGGRFPYNFRNAGRNADQQKGYSFLTARTEQQTCRKLQATEGGYHPDGVPAGDHPAVLHRKTHGTLSAGHQKGRGDTPGHPTATLQPCPAPIPPEQSGFNGGYMMGYYARAIGLPAIPGRSRKIFRRNDSCSRCRCHHWNHKEGHHGRGL